MYMPKTLKEAVEYYANEQVCIDTVAALRWPEGKPVCPKCDTAEGERKHYWLATQKRWKCYSCRKQFSVKVNSVFEDSPLSLSIWLMAMWMLVNCKNGVSSHEIARECGISQKAAWHLLHRIRYALGAPDTLVGGPAQIVEVDEMFLGPKPNKMHASRRLAMKKALYAGSKATVMGVLDRELRQVRAKAIPNVSRQVLQNEILNQIQLGSKVYTDGWAGYDGMAKEYVHETVNHMKEYVRGEIHTQGIENFWSLLRRTLGGTYISTEAFHLDAYITEQVFRYNNRATKDNPLTNADRFMLAVSQISGKRLTFAELTGKVPGSC